MKRKWIIVITFGLLVLMQLAIALPVRACSGEFRETTLREHVDDAALIFVGTVTGSSSDNPYEANYTVQVENYLKGQSAEIVLITGYGSGGGDCQDRIAIGERWLFLADTDDSQSWSYSEGDPKPEGILYASYLQVYDSIMEASDENIAAVSAITGQTPTPGYSVQLATLIKYWTYSPAFRIAVLVGIPAVVLMGGLAFGIARKRGRKSKKKNQG
jgi:hypothetical protein